METEASSTDNYNGCKHTDCPERPALSQFAVDGSFDSCFLSLTEESPWFIVNLNRHHPIALIHVLLKKAEQTEETMSVYVGKSPFTIKCYFSSGIFTVQTPNLVSSDSHNTKKFEAL